MTFFQSFIVAFGLLVSFSTWATCPVLDIDGSKVELYQDATDYADDLLELKAELNMLGEDVEKEISTLPTNDDNLSFVNGDCNDLSLFKKTIWYNNGDLRFVDFAKRIIKLKEAKMRLFLNTNKIKEAMNAADEVIAIEELFELKGSFAGLFFFLIVSFLVRKTQAAHAKEKYLRSATMNFFPKYGRCVRMGMAKDQLEMHKEANCLFVLKGKLAILCILITLLGSLICNEASAAPKLSVWEGRTTKGKCKVEKKEIRRAVKKAVENPSVEAGQMFVKQATNSYSLCLRKVFRKVLLKKIEGLSSEALLLSNGLQVNKKALLNEEFIDELIASGFYLENPALKDAVLMTKVYLHRLAIQTATSKVEEAKVLSR